MEFYKNKMLHKFEPGTIVFDPHNGLGIVIDLYGLNNCYLSVWFRKDDNVRGYLSSGKSREDDLHPILMDTYMAKARNYKISDTDERETINLFKTEADMGAKELLLGAIKRRCSCGGTGKIKYYKHSFGVGIEESRLETKECTKCKDI